MSARTLPDRPNLDQLKRQAKERLASWKAGAANAPAEPRLRDAQGAIAAEYGFASWDALRAHVEGVSGAATTPPLKRGLDYDDPIPDVAALGGPLTAARARELAEAGAAGLRPDATVPADTLPFLASIPSLRRLDLSGRDDLQDGHLVFLEAMPQLTAVSLARCGQITDAGVAYLRGCRQLERVNLQWTPTGDEAVRALAGAPVLGRLLVGNRFTDEGAGLLLELPALAGAGAHDTFLSISSARRLTDAALETIGTLTGVQALDVHMSVFGSPHYTARGVAHLRGMASLEALNFHGRLATDAVLREIGGIARLRWLHCQDIISGDEGFEGLARCVTLEMLATRMCANVTDRGLAAIARLPRLKSLGIGGPGLSDAAFAPLADAGELRDINPTWSRDPAFADIARIPRLERLNNMYNRATTDGATRFLRGHPHLEHYSAFGTRITDESLRILAELPRIESVELENCMGVTDAGLRVLAAAPRLRRLTVWSCINVTGAWATEAPEHVDAKSEAGPPGHAAGYRFETVVGYPDLPMPADGVAPSGTPPGAGLLSTLVCFGGHAAFTSNGVELSVDPGRDTRWMGLVTPELFAAPVRIELVVRPIAELRLFFGHPNHLVTFDAQGFPDDAAPWFTKMAPERGEAHDSRDEAPPLGEWARVTLETGVDERRLLVEGRLRHVWRGDYGRVRGRVGIGIRHQAITVKDLRVDPLPRVSLASAPGWP